MRLRAIVQINSGYGTYPAGRIFEVSDDVAEAWIEARIAVEATADQDPAAGAAAPAAAKPLHRMNKAELTAIAAELGLATDGSNKQLVARISEARDAE